MLQWFIRFCRIYGMRLHVGKTQLSNISTHSSLCLRLVVTGHELYFSMLLEMTFCLHKRHGVDLVNLLEYWTLFLRIKDLRIELMVFTESHLNVKVNRMLVLKSRNQLLFVKQCKYLMGDVRGLLIWRIVFITRQKLACWSMSTFCQWLFSLKFHPNVDETNTNRVKESCQTQGFIAG